MTIDQNIKSTSDCSKFFEGIDTKSENKYILEVKYEKILPEYIKSIIASIENKRKTRAKFITQIEKYKYEE